MVGLVREWCGLAQHGRVWQDWCGRVWLSGVRSGRLRHGEVQ